MFTYFKVSCIVKKENIGSREEKNVSYMLIIPKKKYFCLKPNLLGLLQNKRFGDQQSFSKRNRSDQMQLPCFNLSYRSNNGLF